MNMIAATAQIHPLAVVEDGAVIGDNVVDRSVLPCRAEGVARRRLSNSLAMSS